MTFDYNTRRTGGIGLANVLYHSDLFIELMDLCVSCVCVVMVAYQDNHRSAYDISVAGLSYMQMFNVVVCK